MNNNNNNNNNNTATWYLSPIYERLWFVLAWWKATRAESLITAGLSQIFPLDPSYIRVLCNYWYDELFIRLLSLTKEVTVTTTNYLVQTVCVCACACDTRNVFCRCSCNVNFTVLSDVLQEQWGWQRSRICPLRLLLHPSASSCVSTSQKRLLLAKIITCCH
jgi:hypothetical protein